MIQKNSKPEGIYRKYKFTFKSIFCPFSLILIFVLLVLNTGIAMPDSQPLYNLKRLSEKTQLGLKSNQKNKLDYQYKLLDERLRELEFIVETGNSQYVLTTSLRYSTTAGQITELIINNNLKGESQKAKEKFGNHLQVVKDLPAKYPKADEEVKFIIDDVNYLTTYVNLFSSFYFM